MAKKKKRPANLRQTAPTLTTSAAPGSSFVWATSAIGLLLLLTIPVVSWVSINGSTKTVFALLGDALAAGSIAGVLALLTLLVTALLAMALPFVPVRLWLRESLATALALLSGFTILITVILTQSSRGILAFGDGRQAAEGGRGLIYLLLFAILGTTMAYLARLDMVADKRNPQLAWFGIFAGVLLVLLWINYILIPGSLISPPDFILRQLGR